MSQHDFWVGPIVLGECSGACAANMWALAPIDAVHRLDESEIDGERFLELLAEYGLGPGETECLAVAEKMGFAICTDDGLARRAALQLLGSNRLIGTARILRWSVQYQIMPCTEAADKFEVMKQEGGYLPVLDNGFFCNA